MKPHIGILIALLAVPVIGIAASPVVTTAPAQSGLGASLPGRPDWLGAKAGVTDQVLPPWTPLQVDGNTVKCWGHVYDFAEGFLPAEIITAGESILAGPIELRAVVDDKPVPWRQVTRKTGQTSEARVGFDITASHDSLTLTGNAYLEYDGMLWTDLVLNSPPAAPVVLDSLTIEIPLKASAATLMHYFPGQWGKVSNSGSIPETGWVSGFKPFVWLGNEERGLAWFMESDEQFVVKKNALEITRERGETPAKDIVRLRIHLIDGPFKLAGLRRYAFGLQATPVKPWPKDFHEWRICHGAYYGMEKEPAADAAGTSVTYPANGNIDIAQGAFEAWITPTFDPDVKVNDPATHGRLNRSLFTLRFRDDAEAGFYWNIDDRGMRFYSRVGRQYPLVLGTHSP